MLYIYAYAIVIFHSLALTCTLCVLLHAHFVLLCLLFLKEKKGGIYSCREPWIRAWVKNLTMFKANQGGRGLEKTFGGGMGSPPLAPYAWAKDLPGKRGE